MKNFFVITLILLGTTFTLAQNAGDALRYSMLNVGGTARTVGVGGALGALGADYAVLSVNPAGLSRFRSSEVVLTPSFLIAKVDSRLEGGQANKETASNFNFNNVGIVLHSKPRGGNWKTSNFAIGFNRVANFKQEFRFRGKTKGSITDRFIELADGLFPNDLDNFEAGLAYDVLAIFNPDPNDQTIYSSDFEGNPDVSKTQLVKSSGSINELLFSLGANYNEKLMVGATIGIPFLSYTLDKIYQEQDDAEEIDFFNELRFNDMISTSGVGVNAKIGLIYHLSNMVRVGAAVHTPTFYTLTDNFSTRLTYDYTDANNDGPLEASSGSSTFDYKLKTPFRAVGSVGIIFQKLGFLSADVEYVDYSMSSFNLTVNSTSVADAEYEEEINQDIKDQFGSAINIRLGGEYALKNYRFRAGFGLNGTPYAAENITTSSYSLGLGIRLENFYVDLAYKKSLADEDYVPYQTAVAIQQNVTNEYNIDRILLTLGFKF